MKSKERSKVEIDRNKTKDNKNPKSDQKFLSKLGFYKGKIDGVSFPELLVVYLEWSKANEFAFNGSFPPALVSILKLKPSGGNLGKK